MNELLIYKGGQPVYLEDLDFIQKSIGGAFVEFVMALTDSGDTGDPIVLSGLGRFGTYGFNSGVVAFGGRIYYVDDHADIDDGKHLINFITKKGEPRRLKNGSTVDVYKYEEAVWDSTGWDYKDMTSIDNELVRRLWKSIWQNIERASNIELPPVDTSRYASIGGKLTRTAGGYYVFQGELFTSDNYVEEEPYWDSAEVTVYGPLPSVTVYVPMCYNNSIIPGKVTTDDRGKITVAFWTEKAVPGQIYNFTVML